MLKKFAQHHNEPVFGSFLERLLEIVQPVPSIRIFIPRKLFSGLRLSLAIKIPKTIEIAIGEHMEIW